jgi:subtilisin family serine protease
MRVAARFCAYAIAGMCLALSPRSAFSRPAQGRVIVHLSEAGVHAYASGGLRLPFPAGGDALSPRVEPLFPGASGELGRIFVVRFRSDRGDRTGLGMNAPWLDAIRASHFVENAEDDQVLSVSELPNDLWFLGGDGSAPQFHLWNPGGLSLEAVRAWPFVPADRQVLVAILDTGVDWHHPDLGGPLPPAGVISVNADEANGTPGFDDDHDGQIDDVVGWDFVDLTGVTLGPGQAPAPGEDGYGPDADPSDQAGHGTQVAGLVNAITNNEYGIAGGAPAARILPVRVGWRGSDGGAYVLMSFCAQALRYAAIRGARVANCSWDSANQDGLGAAIAFAADTMNVVVVGSAGNSGTSSTTIEFLASHPSCVGVAGIELDGHKAPASNYGSWVDITAFFRGMPTTDFDYGSQTPVIRVNGFGGTSFAAPQVSGLAALLCAVSDTVQAPTVRAIMKNTARDLSDVEPQYAAGLGGGLADYARAIETLGGGWDAHPIGHGLLPVGNTLAFFTDSTLDRADLATGATVTTWSLGQSPASDTPMLSVEVPGMPSLVVWRESTALVARTLNGDIPPGWPVSVDGFAPVGVAGPPSPTRTIIVPQDSQSVVLDVNVSGVSIHPVPEWPFHTVAAFDPGAQLIVAAARSDGRFEGRVPAHTFEISVGPGLLPPVIGEFSPGEPLMVAAASDSLAPATIQHVLLVDPFTLSQQDVSITAPPLRFVSLAGFATLHRLEIVAADSAGGIHLIDGQGNVRHVHAGGPLAGEVLCADLDGDFESDLLALRADGTLLAWKDDLTPLPAFPRFFPFHATESPVIGDANGQRYVALADTTGHLWSIPIGPAIGPAPWPAASGGGGRSRYLGFAEGTPIHPSLTALDWNWNGSNRGSLCWSGSGFSDLVRLRARVSGSTTAVADVAPREQGCMGLFARHAGERLLLEGQDRRGEWLELGALLLEPPTGLRVGAPRPNPFTAETRLEVSGAVGPVEVQVLDLSGRIVWSRHSIAADIIWSGIDDSGRRVPSGLYFLRVSNAKQSVVRRVLRLD